MNKTTLTAGILVALAVAIGAAVYISQKDTFNAPTTTNGEGTATTTPGIFRSEHIGIEFAYDETTYQLESGHGGEGGANHVVILMDKANLPVGQNTEGPPAITVEEFANPENLALDEWVRTTRASNWHLSSMGEMGASTIGDEPGLGYTYSGLYEQTAIAVAHGSKIYIFSVGTLTAEDKIKNDYFTLLETVKFL